MVAAQSKVLATSPANIASHETRSASPFVGVEVTLGHVYLATTIKVFEALLFAHHPSTYW